MEAVINWKKEGEKIRRTSVTEGPLTIGEDTLGSFSTTVVWDLSKEGASKFAKMALDQKDKVKEQLKKVEDELEKIKISNDELGGKINHISQVLNNSLSNKHRKSKNDKDILGELKNFNKIGNEFLKKSTLEQQKVFLYNQIENVDKDIVQMGMLKIE